MIEIVRTDGNRCIKRHLFPDRSGEVFVVSRNEPLTQDLRCATLQEALQHYEKL